MKYNCALTETKYPISSNRNIYKWEIGLAFFSPWFFWGWDSCYREELVKFCYRLSPYKNICSLTPSDVEAKSKRWPMLFYVPCYGGVLCSLIYKSSSFPKKRQFWGENTACSADLWWLVFSNLPRKFPYCFIVSFFLMAKPEPFVNTWRSWLCFTHHRWSKPYFHVFQSMSDHQIQNWSMFSCLTSLIMEDNETVSKKYNLIQISLVSESK